MHKLIRLVVLLTVIALLLATAAPALADPPQGKVDMVVQPVPGGQGPNAGNRFTPPGAPTVSIPSNNQAIGEAVEPGNVFWPPPPIG